jgi:RNA polymerase sigma-70 factor (ECF subfamily)
VSDAQIVRRLAEGDIWAKEALYRRYVRPVWTTAMRLMGNEADAEDVVQDTFIEAFKDLPRLKTLGSLRHWLLGIAVHQAHRRFRRRRVLRMLGLGDPVSDATFAQLVDPGASPEVHADLERVDRALLRVQVGERFAWILRYVEGNSLEETAVLCDCSLATVKRRIAKANAMIARSADTKGPHE